MAWPVEGLKDQELRTNTKQVVNSTFTDPFSSVSPCEKRTEHINYSAKSRALMDSIEPCPNGDETN